MKTIRTGPEAVQAHGRGAARPMSAVPVERTAVEKPRHVDTMQGGSPPSPLPMSAESSLKSGADVRAGRHGLWGPRGRGWALGHFHAVSGLFKNPRLGP